MEAIAVSADTDELQAIKISRPRTSRDVRGRLTRHPGGEWDWFYDLPDARRAQIRRRHMAPLGMGPDEIATWLGVDVDEAMTRWLEAIDPGIIPKKRGQLGAYVNEFDEWACDTRSVSLDLNDLVGPTEIAERARVSRDVVYQWRHRGQLPEPLVSISGTAIWRWSDVEAMLLTDGRLS